MGRQVTLERDDALFKLNQREDTVLGRPQSCSDQVMAELEAGRAQIQAHSNDIQRVRRELANQQSNVNACMVGAQQALRERDDARDQRDQARAQYDKEREKSSRTDDQQSRRTDADNDNDNNNDADAGFATLSDLECRAFACDENVSNTRTFCRWSVRGNHPDKGGNAQRYARMSDCRYRERLCGDART
jgi:hypothetical protein